MGIKDILIRIKSSAVIRESSSMFIAECIGVFFAFIIVIFRAKFFSVDDIGTIGFITSFVNFFSGFFHLGIDSTGARLIINEPNTDEKRKLAGTVLFIGIILTIVFGAFLAGVSAAAPLYGKPEISYFLYLIIPFAGYNILLVIYKQLCYAMGNIKEVLVQLCISYPIYLITLFIAQVLGVLTLTFAIVCSFAVNMFTVIIPILFIYGRKLRLNRDCFSRLKVEQRARGWKIYLSRVMLVSTSNLDTLIVGLFHPMDSVAYFSLTKYFAMPISMVGNSVSQSIYREYGSTNNISRNIVMKVVITTLLIAVCVSIIAIGAVLIMGNTYYSMFTILPIAVVANIVASINALYNSFMNAKGMADEIKKLSITSAVLKIVSYFILIYIFGALGGMLANLVFIIFVLIMRIYYCRLYTKRSHL